jgi:hypothetical protein
MHAASNPEALLRRACATFAPVRAFLLGDAAIVQSFRGMLPELERLQELAQEMYDQADRVPHRVRYLRLSHAYALRLVQLHREWITEIERELSRGDPD